MAIKKVLVRIMNLSYAKAPPVLLDAVARVLARKSKSKQSDYKQLISLMAQGERLSQDEIVDLQNEKLREIVDFAVTHIPYWKRKFRELNLTAVDIQSFEDLQKLPVLSKDEVVECFDEMLLPRVDPLQLKGFPTGGTTGKPLRVPLDQAGFASRDACYWRWREWSGCEYFEDRCAYIARPPFIVMEDALRWGPSGQRFHGEYNPFSKVLRLANNNLSEQVVRAYVSRMRQCDVAYLIGYPSAIDSMAKIMEQHGLTLKLKAVLTSSEKLFEDTRELVSRVFDCQVTDHYSCNEMAVSATEWDGSGSYLVDMERCVLEVVNDSGQQVWDEAGIVCGTSLDNRAFPLFRYCLNDVATITRRPLSGAPEYHRLISLEGRKDDYVLLPSGIKMTAPTLRQTINDMKGFREFQIIQRSATEIEARIVPDVGWSEELRTVLKERLEHFLGESMRINVRKVKNVERTSGGKFRLIINQL